MDADRGPPACRASTIRVDPVDEVAVGARRPELAVEPREVDVSARSDRDNLDDPVGRWVDATDSGWNRDPDRTTADGDAGAEGLRHGFDRRGHLVARGIDAQQLL